MAEMWFYTSEGKQMEPVSMPELKRFMESGVLKPTDMVWKEGMPRWLRASSVKELYSEPTAAVDRFFTQTADAKPAPLATTAAVTVPEPQKGSTSDKNEPQPQRKPRRSSDDDDRPMYRGRAAAGGSNAGILIALFLGGGVLLTALVVGVVILIVVNQAGPQVAEPDPLAVNFKDVKAKPNPGIDPNNLIKDSTTFAVRLNTDERKSRVHSFRKGARYEFVVRTQQQFLDVDLYVYDMNDLVQVQDAEADADCRIRDWSPPEDGQYRVEVHNCRRPDGVIGVSNSTVTIRETAPPPPVVKKELPKDPEVPEGVLAGAGFKGLDQVPLGQPQELRMRVRANHKAKVNISAAPNLKFRLLVLKDGEDKEVARSVGTGVKSFVEIGPLPATEIVRVRVENISGKNTASSLCTVHYDLGK